MWEAGGGAMTWTTFEALASSGYSLLFFTHFALTANKVLLVV